MFNLSALRIESNCKINNKFPFCYDQSVVKNLESSFSRQNEQANFDVNQNYHAMQNYPKLFQKQTE